MKYFPWTKVNVHSGEQCTMHATVPWKPAAFLLETREKDEVIAMGMQKTLSLTEAFLRLSLSIRELVMSP